MTSLENLTAKYIRNAEHAFETLRFSENQRSLSECKVKEIVELARAYMKDAGFYLKEGKSETALSSIAYCEGLLDALRLLGLIEFEWSKASR